MLGQLPLPVLRRSYLRWPVAGAGRAAPTVARAERRPPRAPAQRPSRSRSRTSARSSSTARAEPCTSSRRTRERRARAMARARARGLRLPRPVHRSRRRRVGFEARHHEARDGTTEVTYHGHPLYTFAGDSAPGQTTGQGATTSVPSVRALGGRHSDRVRPVAIDRQCHARRRSHDVRRTDEADVSASDNPDHKDLT